MSKTLLLVVLVLGVAGSVAAGPNDNWIIYLKAADLSGSNGIQTSCIYGTKSNATDSPAETSNDTSNIAGSGTGAVLGCFDLGVGTNSNGYYKDLRAPYDAVAHPLPPWNLRLWLQPNWTAGDLYLTGWNQAGSYGLNGTIQLALKVVSDPTGSYAAGATLCTFGTGLHGTSTSPEFTALFHNTASIQGGGYVNLQLICTSGASVPEPSSLVFTLSLLGGLSGFLTVRRRRL